MDGLLFLFDVAGRKLAERVAELEQENAALRQALAQQRPPDPPTST